MRTFGIYVITNLINGKRYVGQTVRGVENRFRQHIKAAQNGNDVALGRAIRKYGPANFKVRLVEEGTSKARADRLERAWIFVYNTKGTRGYNLTEGGDGVVGYVHSDTTLAKISAANRGQIRTDAFCAKISAANMGRIPSGETRAKISAAKKGHTHISDAHRAKISAALKGRTHSTATRAKISAANTGLVRSDATRANISAAQKGRTLSDEWRANISASVREALARRRALLAGDIP